MSAESTALEVGASRGNSDRKAEILPTVWRDPSPPSGRYPLPPLFARVGSCWGAARRMAAAPSSTPLDGSGERPFAPFAMRKGRRRP